jgi:putative membrane protein
MDRAQIGDVLALVNASLNATSAVALFSGFYFVKRRSLRMHRRAMLTALSASALFLIFYVTRLAFTGTHEVAGEGAARTVYFSILFSHIGLAILLVPLVLRLVYLVRRRHFRKHARLARWTFPIWAYVSVTGPVVYVLLYQVYGYR